MPTITAHFAPRADAPKAARVFLGSVLANWGVKGLDEPAQLIIGELAANVVRHARTDFELKVEWEAPILRVAVSDGSSIVPAITDLADESGGLGLRMVDNLASEWGIETHQDGKVVWFTLNESATRKAEGGVSRPTGTVK